jgi:hypothetical protein
MPRHLNGLQLSLIRFGRVVFKIRQRGDPLMKIGEPYRQRIHIGMLIHQGEGDVFGLVPGKRRHYQQCYRGRSNVFPRRAVLILLSIAVLCGPLLAQLTPKQKAENLESFELIWRTVRDRHPDPKLNGLNWQAIHDTTKPAIENAKTMQEARGLLRDMIGKLEVSHFAVVPSEAYTADAYRGTAATVESQPVAQPGAISETAVRFGNLPETRVIFESRALPDSAGYIRFNEFLDPASMMPKFEAALKTFAQAPGIILDLRGNPGGIGIMAMGIAGFFIDKNGLKLGDMKMRDATLKFVIFPRPETYAGPLAILVDGGSASTSEILAGGLQDLKRARIFGTRTAGAALPSDIIRLPNGDGFQYPQAIYTSVSGKVLEGAGVTPDVLVPQSYGPDAVIDAADDWIRSTRR